MSLWWAMSFSANDKGVLLSEQHPLWIHALRCYCKGEYFVGVRMLLVMLTMTLPSGSVSFFFLGQVSSDAQDFQHSSRCPRLS